MKKGHIAQVRMQTSRVCVWVCIYLCQRYRLSEKVVSVSFLQLFQRAPQQHQEGSQLHLQRHLLHFDLNTDTFLNKALMLTV